MSNPDSLCGVPPPDHPRRCAGRSRATRRRCKRWALVHSDYCPFHGGRMAAAYRFKRGLYTLPSFYSKYLGPKLAEAVQEALNRPHDEQVAVYEELAISRELAGKALKLSKPLFDPEMEKKLNAETKALMIQASQTAMEHVKGMVLAASKIEKDAKENISIKAVHLIVNQIILAINEVCGTENLELAKSIADAIDQKVRLPLGNKVDQVVDVTLSE